MDQAGRVTGNDGDAGAGALPAAQRAMAMLARQVAYHEAGHAVMAVHLHGKADLVALGVRAPDPAVPRGAHGVYLNSTARPVTRADYASLILILLAGHAAENALHPSERDPRDRGDAEDRHTIAQLVADASARFPDLDAPAATAWVAGLEALAGRLVEAYRPAIEAVAAALQREGRLEGATVLALVEAAFPPPRDGGMARWSDGPPDVQGEGHLAWRLAVLEGLQREHRRILAGELRRVPLTLDEAVLLHQLWGRPLLMPGVPPCLAFTIADKLEFAPLPGERRHTGATLLEKLLALSPGAEAAVVDALDRVDRMSWDLPVDLRLHKVGLGR